MVRVIHWVRGLVGCAVRSVLVRRRGLARSLLFRRRAQLPKELEDAERDKHCANPEEKRHLNIPGSACNNKSDKEPAPSG
jgi:hypothetical protein